MDMQSATTVPQLGELLRFCFIENERPSLLKV